MERERKQNGLVVALLLVTVLSLSVAFAATLSSTLTVNGQATVGNAKWDVHFKTATTATTSDLQATTGPVITGANNVVEYAVTLEENKSYTMEIVVENSGTYDAKLSELTLAGAEDYDFVTYTVEGLNVNETVNANGGTATLIVTVSMDEITNENVEDLENGLTLSLTAIAKFVQADN